MKRKPSSGKTEIKSETVLFKSIVALLAIVCFLVITSVNNNSNKEPSLNNGIDLTGDAL